MSNFAMIENGKVVNTVVADPDYAASKGWVAISDGAGIDWDYINGQFVDNRPAPIVTPPPTPTKEELLAQLQALQAQINSLS